MLQAPCDCLAHPKVLIISSSHLPPQISFADAAVGGAAVLKHRKVFCDLCILPDLCKVGVQTGILVLKCSF